MAKLKDLLPDIQPNQPLKNHTTFKIGGPAEYFFEAHTTDELIKAVKAARQTNTPFIVIGNGSNILVSDKGVKGLVIKNSSQNIKVLDEATQQFKKISLSPRYQTTDQQAIDLTNLQYNQSDYPSILVQLDSGATLPKAIFSLIQQGITGLEWFAGIPATIGGATFINLHGADKYFSDYLVKAGILTSDNQIKTVKADYFNFAYDHSTLKTKKDIVLNATLRLFKGPKDIALKIAKGWALKKSHQPQQSAGCIFQNLSAEKQQELKLPTPSIGYLMDKVLGLKGKKSGNAVISEKHAGFIHNLGNAKAADVLSLIQLMQSKAKEKLNLDLKLEIVLLGFDKV
ncbi:UDP-N-acetylmuramate dehydrogenase [Patescibacteria group bacterium]